VPAQADCNGCVLHALVVGHERRDLALQPQRRSEVDRVEAAQAHTVQPARGIERLVVEGDQVDPRDQPGGALAGARSVAVNGGRSAVADSSNTFLQGSRW